LQPESIWARRGKAKFSISGRSKIGAAPVSARCGHGNLICQKPFSLSSLRDHSARRPDRRKIGADSQFPNRIA
jgi:hypothetical protein